MEPADQKRIISLIVKSIRDGHKGFTHEAKAARILSKITTAQMTGFNIYGIFEFNYFREYFNGQFND